MLGKEVLAGWQVLLHQLQAVTVLDYVVDVIEEAVVRTVIHIHLDAAVAEVVVGGRRDADLEV